MDVNRIVIEMLLVGNLAGIISQVTRYFYQSHQISFLLYLAVKMLILALALAVILRIKSRDFSELMLLSGIVFVALWIRN